MVTAAAGLLERLLRSPLAQQAEAEMQAEVLEQRKALVAELARLESERDAEMPKLAAKRDAAREAFTKAERALVQAREQMAAASGACMGASYGFNDQIARQQAKLRELAPAAIGEFVHWCRGTAETARSQWDSLAGGGPASLVYREDYELARQVAAENAKVKERRLAYLTALREAATWAEGLQYQALADGEIEAQLASKRAALEGMAPR